MSDDVSDTQRDNPFAIGQQKAVQKGFAAGRAAVQQRFSGAAMPATCEAPGCTNVGGAFIAECDGRIYEFCSEGCRAKFTASPSA